MKYNINKWDNDGGCFSATPIRLEVALIYTLETDARNNEKIKFNLKMVLL
jgi:hypothetical protein